MGLYGATTFSITRHIIMTRSITIRKYDTQHNDTEHNNKKV